jgi:hypothetical protein
VISARETAKLRAFRQISSANFLSRETQQWRATIIARKE